MVDWYWLGGFVLSLVALAFLQRRLHFELQAIFLLITHRADITLVLFSLIFFPGVLLHEASHFITARLLGVRTGRFSLIPKPLPNGRLQLGYVETAQVDLVRDALIGLAPLLMGGAFVALVGLVPMGLSTLWAGLTGGGTASEALKALIAVIPVIHHRPDFYLWFYLVFAVSSTLLPSASDRRTWLPILLAGCVGLGLVMFVGAGPWLLAQLAPLLNQVLWASALVFGISATIHLVVWLPLWGVRMLIGRLRGMEVG